MAIFGEIGSSLLAGVGSASPPGTALPTATAAHSLSDREMKGASQVVQGRVSRSAARMMLKGAPPHEAAK
jgi:hypothetical protein